MVISSVDNGALLRHVQEITHSDFEVSSVALSRRASTCAFAWAHKLIVFSVPWDEEPHQTLATYSCPQV